jgi:hypothetical protein
MRLPEADIAKIDRAAMLRGRSRTDFVREAAVRAAEEVPMENRLTRHESRRLHGFPGRSVRPVSPGNRNCGTCHAVQPAGSRAALRSAKTWPCRHPNRYPRAGPIGERCRQRSSGILASPRFHSLEGRSACLIPIIARNRRFLGPRERMTTHSRCSDAHCAGYCAIRPG